MQASRGVYPPSAIVQGQPAAPVGPQQLVVEPVQAAEPVEPLDVTVFLTSWSRPHLLREQYLAIANQSRPPASLVAWVNAPPAGGPPGVPVLDEEVLASMVQVRSSINWGPRPRFLFAMEAKTEYVVILDDDAFPGEGWLEAAISAVANEGVAVAVSGSLFDSEGNETIVGAGNAAERTTVDAGRQGWVLRREWLEHVLAKPWKAEPFYGWGIHISAALQAAGIDTVVLPYGEDGSTWGTVIQEQADGLRNIPEMPQIRSRVFSEYRNAGWELREDLSPPATEGAETPATPAVEEEPRADA